MEGTQQEETVKGKLRGRHELPAWNDSIHSLFHSTQFSTSYLVSYSDKQQLCRDYNKEQECGPSGESSWPHDAPWPGHRTESRQLCNVEGVTENCQHRGQRRGLGGWAATKGGKKPAGFCVSSWVSPSQKEVTFFLFSCPMADLPEVRVLKAV